MLAIALETRKASPVLPPSSQVLEIVQKPMVFQRFQQTLATLKDAPENTLGIPWGPTGASLGPPKLPRRSPETALDARAPRSGPPRSARGGLW